MTKHIPILLDEIVSSLTEGAKNGLNSGTVERGYVVDCTLGGGGHTEGLLSAIQKEGLSEKLSVVSFDRDVNAIDRAKRRFAEQLSAGTLQLVHSNFDQVASELKGKPVVGLLADLGFSSDQLEDHGRGLSFQNEGPLDMRLDREQGPSCFDFLQTVKEEELFQLIKELGEDRFARSIARNIVRKRGEGELQDSTLSLAEIIKYSVPKKFRYGRIHPATRTFQALRIHLNDELGALDALLESLKSLLVVGGRAAFLSFHSLEDRRVKRAFLKKEVYRRLTKKPVVPSDEEISHNPRARSAKLRVAERIDV